MDRRQLFSGELTCGDCEAKEGQLHEIGCDMELCPFCGGQLISCDCIYEKLDLFDPTRYGEETAHLPPDIYRNGPTVQQWEQWLRLLDSRGRIPFILYPNMCSRCGVLWPEFFKVKDEEWRHYIQPDKRRTIICRECYDYIKAAIDADHSRRAKRGEER